MDNLSPFYSPFTEIILKSDPNDDYTIFIEASNESPDQQSEVLFMKALENEAENYLRKGIISWDHLHKIKGNPEYIIGEPEDVGFKGKKTFVKGRLYKGVRFAEAVVRMMKANSSRLGASVGGFIRRRKKMAQQALSGVTGVLWDETAITYKPVNDTTMGKVSLIPIGAFAKALAAGTGVDAGSFTGGRALSNESLQGANAKKKEKLVETVVNELVWRLSKGDIRSEEDFKDFLEFQNAPFLYGQLKNLVVKKFNRRF